MTNITTNSADDHGDNMDLASILARLADADMPANVRTLDDTATSVARELIRVISAKTGMTPDLDPVRADLIGTLVRDLRRECSALATELTLLSEQMTPDQVEVWTRDGTAARLVVRADVRGEGTRCVGTVSSRHDGTLGRALGKYATRPKRAVKAEVKAEGSQTETDA